MWATFNVNLINPQQKQGANGEWVTGYVEPWTHVHSHSSTVLKQFHENVRS